MRDHVLSDMFFFSMLNDLKVPGTGKNRLKVLSHFPIQVLSEPSDFPSELGRFLTERCRIGRNIYEHVPTIVCSAYNTFFVTKLCHDGEKSLDTRLFHTITKYELLENK